MNCNGGKWIRPATKFEEFLDIIHHGGSMISSYWLRLSSKEPLKPDDVKLALQHLYR